MRAGLAASTVTPGSTAPDVSLTTPETPAALVPCANVAVGVSKALIATQTATPTLAIRVIFRLPATVFGIRPTDWHESRRPWGRIALGTCCSRIRQMPPPPESPTQTLPSRATYSLDIDRCGNPV